MKKEILSRGGGRKGFTLVELAIVLVVIGLLMGMAFKGKSLVDAARIKSELNKINKISTAINTYYSKYGTLPGVLAGVKPTNKIVYDALVTQENMLKESDFKSVGDASAGAGSYWNFIGCKDTYTWWTIETMDNNLNLCIYRSYNETKNNTTDLTAVVGGGLTKPAMDAKTICQIETILDDKNIYSGDGRSTVKDKILGTGNVSNTSWDCSNNTEYNGKDFYYAYRIF